MNAEIVKGEVLSEGVYTSRELRVTLARYRQRKVPDRTLRWWRNQLGIRPNVHGVYEEEDLKILIRLIRWMSRGGTVQSFKSILLEEMKNASRSRTTTEVG